MTAHFPPPRRFPAGRRSGKVLQFRRRASPRVGQWWPFVALPALAFAVVFAWPAPSSVNVGASPGEPLAGPAPWAGQRTAGGLDAEQPALPAGVPNARDRDTESARFFVCGPGARSTCVVDGDTFWYRGAKIRIADINTPEVSSPGCAAEAALGARATGRLVELLNAGPFTLAPIDRDTDRYGRRLRVVTRAGRSVGGELVDEGLAERWQGFRRDWC